MTYLRARCLYKIVEGMMPKEAWSKKKPTTKHLRIFGCEAYTFIPKKMRTKVEAKSLKCIFVGYSAESKASQLIDSTMGKFKVSHDVVFNKTNNSCSKLDTT
jgi:ribosomal protein L13